MNRGAKRPSARVALLGAAAIILAGAAAWIVLEHPHTSPAASAKTVATFQPEQRELTRRDYVSALVRQGNDEAVRKLVACYVAWAGVQDAIDTRQDILDALFKLESLARRLDATLRAIALDPTPPEDDSLWHHAVDRMSQTWQRDEANLPLAQELMLLETRPRARRFMATAMAQFAQSEPARQLSETRRIALSQDLIDIYFGDRAEAYRSELEPAIRSLSGNDVALLLKEGPEGVKLGEMGILVRRDHAIQQAARDLASK